VAYVLIVDDDADFASAVSIALQARGHETQIETDCARTLPSIGVRRPDVVILDVMFPENDKAGFETARAIRRTYGEVGVILLTAVNQAFPLGFSDKDLDPKWLPALSFLEKPVDLAHLCNVVAQVTGHPPAPK
jgi:CheY-like chemotaxis protein